MISKAIYGKLSTTVSVTAVTSTRIYPDLAPAGVALPYIVFEVEDREETATYGADGSGLTSRRFTVAMNADTKAGADALAELVLAALDQESGTWGGIVVQGCFSDGGNDGKFIGDGTEQQTTFYCEQDYLIWFNS